MSFPHVRQPKRSCRPCAWRAITLALHVGAIQRGLSRLDGMKCSPAIGNPGRVGEMSIRWRDERDYHPQGAGRRAGDIACVTGQSAAGAAPESQRTPDERRAGRGSQRGFDREAYAQWLKKLRKNLPERGIC